jgi:hypothetical protein
MDKPKFKYRRILEFQEAVSSYRQRVLNRRLEEARAAGKGKPEDELEAELQAIREDESRRAQQGSPKNKFEHAVGRALKGLRRAAEEHADSTVDINVEHASLDKDGNLVMDGERFRYSRDGMKARLTALRALMDVEHEVEPYFATEVPEDLTEDERDAFTGFVLRPATAGDNAPIPGG